MGRSERSEQMDAANRILPNCPGEKVEDKNLKLKEAGMFIGSDCIVTSGDVTVLPGIVS